jgi:predicted nuclease of restriction endonuclease-like (RecB) superfamily
MADKHRKASLPVKYKPGREVPSQRIDESGRMTIEELPASYGAFLEELKKRIRTSRVKAALAANRELIVLYWHIGKSIVERQRVEGWGVSVINRLAADIQSAFPGIEGFSPSNISRMRAFYLAWTEGFSISAQAVPKLQAQDSAQVVPEIDGQDLPQVVREIPWGHNVVLLFKLKTPAERLWYASKTIEHGWSRPVLVHQIELGLCERQGKAVTNFDRTLPPPQSDMAQQMLKDPYVFDFLTIREDAAERELERGLLAHIQKFLLELGVGFAFVGSQYHLEVEGEDFYIDLLFYHLHLRCYVVIDLKVRPFKPEFAGKMNFYLSAVDAQFRRHDDNPSIGIILCKTRKKLIVEYALRNTATPIGVSEYQFTRAIPAELKSSLPTIEELEKELSNGE